MLCMYKVDLPVPINMTVALWQGKLCHPRESFIEDINVIAYLDLY